MTATVAPDYIPCVYTDWSVEEQELEMARVHDATAVEREWIQEAGLKPFMSDQEIIDQAADLALRRVGVGVGYVPIQRLRDWSLDRSNPSHQYHYSPPVLRQDAMQMLGLISHNWSKRFGAAFALPVTSTARSYPYQVNISSQEGKVAIDPDEGLSSHLFALSFDIDAFGLYKRNGAEVYAPTNPFINPADAEIIRASRDHLREILETRSGTDINFVEENEGTRQHVFHVCTRPVDSLTRLVIENAKANRDRNTLPVPAIRS